MIKLLGYTKLQSDLVKLSQFQKRVHGNQLKRVNAYRTKAREIVRAVVYSHPENPAFPRSGNLAATADVSSIMGGDSVATHIFLNPARATRAFPYGKGRTLPLGLRSFAEGRFLYYPSYVRRGTFFRKKMEPRDFILAWANHFGPEYRKHMAAAIRNFKRG